MSRFNFDRDKFKIFVKRTLLFLAPTLLVLLGSISDAIPQWIPKDSGKAIIVLFILNRLTNFVELYIKNKPKE